MKSNLRNEIKSYIVRQGMTIACRNTHFLFAKKKQKQGRKDGENEWRFTT